MASNDTAAPRAGLPAFPLATTAAHRVLAWPRYDRRPDLEALIRVLGPSLIGRQDLCLCLRHDPAEDIPLGDAMKAVGAALEAALGANTDIEVLLVDDPLDDASWSSLGRAVTGIVALPSSSEPQRHARLVGLGHPLITSGEELRRRLVETKDIRQPSANANGSATANGGASAGTNANATPAATATTRVRTTSKPKGPTVSVIVPTFNRLDFLPRALDSLAAQTFSDFEVVIVNDAGDPLEAALARFTSAMRITYVRHADNRYLAAARNSGLALARGRYIAYLDDDDFYRPDHLATLVEALSAGSYKVAYTDASWVLEEKTPSGYKRVREVLQRSAPFNRDRMMVGNYIPVLSVMHERACIEQVGRFDEDLGTHEDWDLFIRLACRYDFLHVAKVTAEISWRQDGSSMTSANGPDFMRTLDIIHRRYHDLVKDNPRVLALQQEARLGAIAPADQAIAIIRRARALVSSGDLSGARQTLHAALALAPQSADLLLTLVDVLVAEGHIPLAEQVLEQAAKLHPADATIRLRLAQQAQTARS